MIHATGFRRMTMFASAALILAGVTAARADDTISASHLAAAKATIAALHATDGFDAILPAAAEQLKSTLIQKDPNLESLIVQTVDNQTLALASRRADLENEAARAYAKSFSEDDLKAITQFYTSPVGKKLISDGPIVMREVGRAAQIWQNGIARDLAEAVGKELEKNAPKESTGAPTPADQPAPSQPAPSQPAPKQ